MEIVAMGWIDSQTPLTVFTLYFVSLCTEFYQIYQCSAIVIYSSDSATSWNNTWVVKQLGPVSCVMRETWANVVCLLLIWAIENHTIQQWKSIRIFQYGKPYQQTNFIHFSMCHNIIDSNRLRSSTEIREETHPVAASALQSLHHGGFPRRCCCTVSGRFSQQCHSSGGVRRCDIALLSITAGGIICARNRGVAVCPT